MQLSLSRFIVIVSLLIAIVRAEYKEEYKKCITATEDRIDRMALDESINEAPREESFHPCIKIQRKKRQSSHPRNGRTTYVKAILANPKLTPSQQMAQKLARAELESPKMQETFKKLTAVHASRQNPRDTSGLCKISSPFARSPKVNSHKPPRFKGPRKRKRKRHKSRRRNGAGRTNSGERKVNNYRIRLTRQTANSSSKKRAINPKRRNRFGKSVEYEPKESLNEMNFDKNQNFDEDPAADLDLESFDTNLQNSGIYDSGIDSLNYVPNYSPIADPNDNLENLDSLTVENQDFSIPNDQSMQNGFILPEDDNSYAKNLNTGLVNNEAQERQNSLMRSNQFGDQNQYRIYANQNGIPDGSNAQRTFQELHYQNNQNVISNRFDQRNNRRDYENLNTNQYGRGSSYPNYRSGSINPINVQRLAEKNAILSSNMNSGLKNENNSGKSHAKTIKGTRTIDRGEYSKQQSRRASRVGKSERSMEKSVSGTSESCTTTEMNPKLKGIGEASAIPLEMAEKTMGESKSLKGMEYHLLPMSTAVGPQAAMAKPLQFQESNETAAANQTKEVAGQILNKIIEELEDLKIDRTKNDQKEGLPCRLSGSWITTLAGVRIDMLVTNRTVNVSMAKLNLPVGIVRQGILNHTWNITGYAPFKRGGPFSLVATDNHTKSLAVFVGACRVCQGIDTIEGVWSVAREPRDCRDFQVATSIYNDIFRRTKLLSAIKARQLEMTSTTKCTSTTTNMPATKEDNLSAILGGKKIA